MKHEWYWGEHEEDNYALTDNISVQKRNMKYTDRLKHQDKSNLQK